MIEINVYYFYWLSAALNWTVNGPPEGPASIFTAALAMSKTALESALDTPISLAFPKATEHMQNLLSMIDQMLESGVQCDQNRRVIFDADHLKEAVRIFAATLEQEARHSYVLCVRDQRCLSAYALVEKIEHCFSPKTWRTMDRKAKNEIEEAGKCLALERYTGAGFHSLRAIECVMRQFLTDLTGALPTKRDWGHYIDVLEKHAVPADALAVLRDVKTRERNPLMHPEDWLDVDDAVALFTISQAAIARLASEMQRRFPSKYPVTAGPA